MHKGEAEHNEENFCIIIEKIFLSEGGFICGKIRKSGQRHSPVT